MKRARNPLSEIFDAADFSDFKKYTFFLSSGNFAGLCKYMDSLESMNRQHYMECLDPAFEDFL